MRKVFIFFITFIMMISFLQCKKSDDAVKKGTVRITFKNTVKGSPLILNTGSYTNSFAQSYTVSKLKYYVSNVTTNFSGYGFAEPNSYHLIDESIPTSLSFSFDADVYKYQVLNFMIGVDSLRNVSGAQTGALDPLNDMFWTWSTGYIMAKLEGTSPASTQVNNKLQFHIGGFSGANNAIKIVSLLMPANNLLDVREGKTSEIFIEADIDKWFSTNVNFSTEAAIMTPGVLSNKIADNYKNMFTITQVLNN
jgi:hypothetical protein